jgi:small GTP-binding protein
MSDHAPTPETRCGFIAVIGAPNAGKSTLVNTLVGAKVSIVSRKVQTTRMPVRGIAVGGKAACVHHAPGSLPAAASIRPWWMRPGATRVVNAIVL